MSKKYAVALLVALVLAVMLALPVAAQGQGYGNGPADGSGANCPNGEFVDMNSDGVCDNAGTNGTANRYGSMAGQRNNVDRPGAGPHGGFVDEDGDGQCDQFGDEDGDGICDNCQGDGNGMQHHGNGNGMRRQANQSQIGLNRGPRGANR